MSFGTRGAMTLAMAVVMSALPLNASALSAPVATAGTRAVKIMLVGDSMTEGSSGDWTWRYRLAKYLDAAGVEYEFVGPRTTMLDLGNNEHDSHEYVDPDFDQHHFSLWGMSLHRIIDENGPETDSIGWAVSQYQPDVIVEALGINDLLYGSSPAETLSVANQFVSEVRAAKSDTSLVMSTVPDTGYAHVADYNDLLTSMAPSWSTQTSPVAVADAAPGWDSAADTCDGTHPSATGEVEMAAAVVDALSGLGIGDPAPRPLPSPPPGPRQPAVLSATPGDGQVTMSWTLPPGGDAVLISTRDATLDQPWRRLPYVVGGNGWLSSGLTNGHTYQYRLNVLKHSCLADDVVSDVVTVIPQAGVPDPVDGVIATGSDHGLSVSWAPTPRATSYVVWMRNVTDGGGWITATTTATSFATGSLVAGATYDVQVQATGDGGAGALSQVVSSTPTAVPPASPSFYSADADATGAGAVYWSPVGGATGYSVWQREASAGAAWVEVPGPGDDPGRTSAVFHDLVGGHVYEVEVRADDGHVAGVVSPPVSFHVPRLAPTTGARGHRVANGSIRTRADAAPGATTYQVWTAYAARCGHMPTRSAFTLRSVVTRPRLTFRARGRVVWVRWYAVRGSVLGRLARTSSACIGRH